MAAIDQINQGGTTYEIVPEIAELFSTTKAYHTGDHVIYEAGWYTFKADKTVGAWDATKVDGPFKVSDQLSDLKEDLNNIFTFDSTDWVLGTLNPGTGTQGTSATRVLSPYIEVSKNDIITYLGNENCLVVYEFDANKGYLSDSPWSGGNKYTVTSESAEYIRILVRKDSANSTIAASEIPSFVADVSLYKIIPKSVYDFDTIEEYFQYLKSVFNLNEPTFTNGYYINYQTGAIVQASGYSYVTADISLFRGGNIKGQTSSPPNAAPGIAFYDDGGTYIIGYRSTNTGIYAYPFDLTVPENAKTVRITLRDATASQWKDIEYPWEVLFGNIQTRLDNIDSDVAKKTDEIIKKVDNARHIKEDAASPLTLLHFSDLHADKAALIRIMDDAKKLADHIDDAICTGDIVSNTYGSISDWWDASVMTCIGNHDSASYNSSTGYNWTALSMANRDAYYIAPFESNWGITHTSGTSYYYKDYTEQKIRMIVMDAMLYSSYETDTSLGEAQTAWLINLLSDAITNDLHVLIAIHASHDGATAIDCSFSRYGQSPMPLWNDCNTPQSVINAVASAITNGLHFIGYLVGHTHQDNIWDAEGDGTQIMYCVTCANTVYKPQWINSDQYRDNDADAYNLVTIDTANTLVKIIRGGGADIDDHMRSRKAICFNYSTGEKVGEVL